MENQIRKTVTFGEGKVYSLDAFGFLDPPEQWDEDFAQGMARMQGIYDGLTEEHWGFIGYIREQFTVKKQLPLMVEACTANNLRLRKFRSLFPTGYLRGACRIAGINNDFMIHSSIWHSYETVPHLQREFEVTPQGFLVDFNLWTERFAHIASCKWGLPEGLTSVQWEVIHFLRNYYQITNNIPTVLEICQAHNLDIDDLQTLFPGGYRRGACLIAGLPFFG